MKNRIFFKVFSNENPKLHFFVLKNSKTYEVRLPETARPEKKKRAGYHLTGESITSFR